MPVYEDRDVSNRLLAPILIYLLSQAVEHHDVCIHVVGIVSVRWITFHCPLMGLGALGGEHVPTVFGLVIHTVEAGNLSGEASHTMGSI